jgi:hypothetical protein
MRYLHRDSSLRLAIAARQDPDGYVATLLGLAREQIIAQQVQMSASGSPKRYTAASSAWTGRRPNLH